MSHASLPYSYQGYDGGKDVLNLLSFKFRLSVFEQVQTVL